MITREFFDSVCMPGLIEIPVRVAAASKKILLLTTAGLLTLKLRLIVINTAARPFVLLRCNTRLEVDIPASFAILDGLSDVVMGLFKMLLPPIRRASVLQHQ